ncbi:Protein aurora borealis [Caenorhabditis elegans]|uniref:Protein aurora borealis n=1 Tax=Caenorhabditis elegans TaxID=6239 RepID=G5ECT7_CAEEL|nr:Protein aurora borealis [Caenorhabditis elegans]CAB05528.3 Protein aurora borealis [Caenorhabditis elegans]|eukprot:NP_001254434.1 Suppressor of PAr-Two defect [Caenorhabditis elegans]
MEFNVSSFCEGEESRQLNSTALEHDENGRTAEWKVSPIAAERPSKIFPNKARSGFKTPLRSINTTDPSTSGYDSKSITPQQNDPKLSMSAELSSFIANNSLNPLDSILLNSLHKSINFSPRVVFSQESCSQQKDSEKFQWSIEQLAILKPAHISDDEIAASYRSPIPEVEEKIQEVLNEYWTKNVSYIPSPDGPRYINLSHRDGTVTTFTYGAEENATSSSAPGAAAGTPASLANIVRKKEAVKAAYATSSPKQRPRKNIRQVRNRPAQTELTIPPNLDLDLKKLLGEQFVYQPDEEDEEDDEEVFNVSVSSNFSTRRRLFSAGGTPGAPRDDEDEADDVENSSMLSNDDLMLNETNGQHFNDSLSPVRKDVTDDIDEPETSMTTSGATASQIAINISILNDCMMNSIDEEEIDGNEEEGKNEAVHHQHNVFSHSHLDANEYEILDRSSSSNATPRHEDLDWTPRRFPGSANSNPMLRGIITSGGSGGGGPQDFRRFVFDMSPIHPNHNAPGAMRTPLQRCHPVNLPRGRLDLNDDDEEDENTEK